MADRDLTIQLKLDRSQATRQSEAFHSHERAAIDQTKSAHAQAEGAVVRGYDKARDAQGRFVKGLGEQAQGLRESTQAAEGFTGSVVASAAGFAAMGSASAVLKGVLKGFADARAEAEKFGQSVVSRAGELRALASVAGQQADPKFVLKAAAFGAETGLGFTGGREYQEALLNRAQIVRGKNLPEAEFEPYAKLTGALGASKNIPGSIAGDVAGGIVKAERFGTAGQAAAREAQALNILDAGAGDMKVLAEQFSQVLAFVSDNALESSVRNPAEAAALVSLAAEFKDTEAFTTVSRTITGMRDFQNKGKAAFFAASGIKPGDTAIEALRKSNRVIGEQVAKGVPVDVALQGFGFGEEMERRGAQLAFNRRDIFETQAARAAAAPDPAAVSAAVDTFKAGQVGRDAIGRALLEAQTLAQGTGRSAFEAEKPAVEADLRAAGVIGTPLGNLRARVATGFGFLGDPTTLRVEAEVARRAGTLDATPLERGFNRAMGRLGPLGQILGGARDLGEYYLGNAPERASARLAAPDAETRALKDSIDKLREAFEARTPPGRTPPPALPGAPGVVNRGPAG